MSATFWSRLGFGRARRLPVVLQATVTDCGPACLAMVLAHWGRGVPLDALRDELGAGRDGVTALELRDAARRYGLRCSGRRIGPADIQRLPLPCVVHWEGNHFVVVERMRGARVELVDPVLGRRRVSLESFATGFAGVVLTFGADGPPPRRRPASPTPPAWRTVLLPALHVRRPVLAVLGATSALLVVAGLSVPLATAWIVDRLAASSAASAPGGGLLGPAAVAMLAAAIGALTLVRGLTAAAMQQHVGRHLASGLVDRLLRAPLAFFEQRGSGEVAARLTATDAVRDALATQLIGAVLDVVVALSYLVVLGVVSPELGLVTFVLGVAQLAVLGGLAVRGRRQRREELLAQVRCQGWLFGILSGLAWVKAAGAEQVVRARWQRLHERRLEALLGTARTAAVGEAVTGAFRVAGPLLLLLAAASLVGPAADGGPGRVVGLAALATAALVPVGALVGHLRSFHDIGSLIEHLGDLATAPPEQAAPLPPAPALRGELVTKNLGFRHTRRGPWVLRNVDLRIPAGGKLAVVGASGSGKSTLVKLLAGLYAPTEGMVCVDGRDVRSLDLRSVRRQLGVVLQDPFLLSGTVAENIALRRPDAQLDDVIAAACLAAVHDDISALPLGYATTLTTGGAEFSGGQRQRVALARALLDRPSVLILDEATSHLDSPTEARIELNLRGLGITRIVVAHRLSTVHDADLILVLEDGLVVEAGSHPDLVAARRRYAAMVASQEMLAA